MDTLHETRLRDGIGRLPRARRERQILAAAAAQFGLHGYESASVAAIADTVGVTKTLVHHYFGSKRDLHLATLTWAGGELLTAIEAPMSRSAPDPGPEPALRNLFATLERRRMTWLLMADALQHGEGGAVPAVRRCRDAVDRIASCCLDGALHPGTEEDPAESAALRQGWWGLITGLVRWWTRHPEQSAHSMADRCARLLAISGTVGP